MKDNESYRYDSRSFHTSGTRWAEDEEIQKSLTKINISDEQYEGCGVPLISNGYTAYVDASDSHTLILGSTGSKKSRLLIMPAMCSIARGGESVICTDPKGELYQKTSGLFQKEGYKILVLNLRDPEHSHGWSPLHMAANYATEGNIDKAYETINDLAASIFMYSPRIDPFWADSCRMLFRALAGLIIESPSAYEPYSLNTINNLLDQTNDELYGEIRDIIQQYPDESQAIRALKAVTTGSEKTYSNIKATFQSGLQTLFSRGNLTQLLSTPDIQFDSLGIEKTAFYIIMPDEKTTLHPIVSLIIKQCYERLITTAQNYSGKSLPVRVNFVLDEFSNLPAIPDMSSMISAARSRNIRFTLVVQSLNQLSSKYYDDAYTIRGNCNNWVFLYSKELAMLQEISDLCGASNITGERLISVSQLQRLNKDNGEALLLCGRSYPYISYLADIDDYDIPFEEPAQFPSHRLYNIETLDTKQVCERLAMIYSKKSQNVPEILCNVPTDKPAGSFIRGLPNNDKEQKDVEGYSSVLKLVGFPAKEASAIAQFIEPKTTHANAYKVSRFILMTRSMASCFIDPSVTGKLFSLPFNTVRHFHSVTNAYDFSDEDYLRYIQHSDHWYFTQDELEATIEPMLTCVSISDMHKIIAEICIAGDQLIPAGEIVKCLRKLTTLEGTEDPITLGEFLIKYSSIIFSKVSLFFTEFLNALTENGINSFSIIARGIQIHEQILNVYQIEDNTEYDDAPICRRHYLDTTFLPLLQGINT